MIRNKPRGATVYGIDLGKNIFHVVGTESAGNVVQRVKFRRDTLRAFFERAERAVVTHRQRINVACTELIGRAHLDEEV